MYGRLGLAMAALLMSACAGTQRAAAPVQLTSANVAVASTEPPHVDAPDAEEPTVARVVVHQDLAERCPALQGAAERGWRAELEELATCLKSGDLKAAHVAVRGGEKTRAGVRCVLDKLGIAEERVDLVDAAPSMGGDERVDLALAPGGFASATVTTLSVDRGEVAAFLSDDTLE